MKNIFALLLSTVLFMSAVDARAAFSPIGFSLLAPVQFPPTDFSVSGLRASAFWGRHRQVYGFDLGLVGNITEQNFAGLSLNGVFSNMKGSTTILFVQAAGVANVNTGQSHIFGFQLAGALNWNTAESYLTGFQVALLGNYSPHTIVKGAQVGAYNSANEVYGFQIGLINVAENLHGIQIGVVNFNKKGMFSAAPILKVGF